MTDFVESQKGESTSKSIKYVRFHGISGDFTKYRGQGAPDYESRKPLEHHWYYLGKLFIYHTTALQMK